MNVHFKRFSISLFLLLLTLPLFSQNEELETAEQLVNYCIKYHDKKVGRGQCTDLIFYALSDLNKSLYNDARNVNYTNEELHPGDIVHLQWKKGLKERQHYMIVMEVIEGSKVKIAHQNFNNQLKVVYSVYDLHYEKTVMNRQVSVYRLS